jgi:hypothetical protein
MNLKLPQIFCGASAAAFLAIAILSPAQAAENVRVRGTIVGLDGSTLTVKTREGPNAVLMMKPGWKMAGVAKASVDDIKPGDFVGIASLPTASGGDGAVEVLVFPPAMKGTGEGSYPWDLKPKSSMTNATVTNAVKGVEGGTLDLSYSGGKEKKISVPDGVPIVTLARRPRRTSSPARPSSFPPSAATTARSPPASLSSARTASTRRCEGSAVLRGVLAAVVLVARLSPNSS